MVDVSHRAELCHDLPAETDESCLALPWYVVYTKHQHEKSAADALTRKDFEVLLPLYRSARRWKDRTQTVTLPLFPCYLFIRTELSRKLEILKTPGVFWLVESGGRACTLSTLEVEAIRRVTESKARVEPHPYLRSGDLVRIVSGPLAGIEGLLVRVRNLYRVVLSVDLLQKAVSVEVDSSILERLGRAAGDDRPGLRRADDKPRRGRSEAQIPNVGSC